MKRTLVPLAVLSTLLAACTPSQDAPTPESRGTNAESAIPVDAGVPGATRGIAVSDAWSRAMPPGARVAGGFMTIRNGGDQDDRLLSLSSPAAGSVDVHEMREVDGVMQMRPLVDGLVIPAGGEVVLKPGGYHLMFMQPVQPFQEGDTVTATLVFEHAGEQQVEFDVRGLGATGPGDGDDAAGGHDHH